MCLDILIREGSNGERSLLSLMKELSLKYGQNKPFVDDDIIDEIIASEHTITIKTPKQLRFIQSTSDFVSRDGSRTHPIHSDG